MTAAMAAGLVHVHAHTHTHTRYNEMWPTGGWGSVEYGPAAHTPGQIQGGQSACLEAERTSPSIPTENLLEGTAGLLRPYPLALGEEKTKQSSSDFSGAVACCSLLLLTCNQSSDDGLGIRRSVEAASLRNAAVGIQRSNGDVQHGRSVRCYQRRAVSV